MLKGWEYFQSWSRFQFSWIDGRANITYLSKYMIDPACVAADLEDFSKDRVEYKKIISAHPDISKYAQKPIRKSDANNICQLSESIFSQTHNCSTSSNMGISIHECIRAFQAKPINIEGAIFFTKPDEGKLVIWCPDREADL